MQQTDNLKEYNQTLKTKNDTLIQQHQEISKGLIVLENDRGNLQLEKRDLNNSVTKLKKEVKQSPFNENLNELFDNPRMGTTPYNSLIITMKKKTEFHDYYITTVSKIIDSTKDFFLQAVLSRLLYESTNDIKWQNKLFEIGQLHYKDSKNENGNDRSLEFWWMYKFGQTFEDRRIFTEYLITFVKKLENNDLELRRLATVIGYSQMESGFKLDLYQSNPIEFCILLQKSKQFSLEDDLLNYFDLGDFIFLENHAPIAFLCVVSEIMKSSKKISDDVRSRLLKTAQEILDRNYGTIEKPSDVNNAKSWSDWQVKYQDLVDITFNVKKYCNDKNEIRKIIGKLGTFTN